MNLLAISFANIWLLAALAILPLVYFLLRLTPPKPNRQFFAPLFFLTKLKALEEQPSKTPWWLVLLRLLIVALVILAMAEPQYQTERNNEKLGEKSILIVLDDRWSTAPHWQQRIDTIKSWLEHAESSARLVTLITPSQSDFTMHRALDVQKKLAASQPQPSKQNISSLAQKITAQTKQNFFNNFDTYIWFNNALDANGNSELARALENTKIKNSIIYLPNNLQLLTIGKVQQTAENLRVEIARLTTTKSQIGTAIAFNKNGEILAQETFTFAEGKATTEIKFSQPIELRNEFFQIKLQQEKTNTNHAGSTYLLDSSFKRKKVALVAGEASSGNQPLLSMLYFLQNALEPFTQIQTLDINDEEKINSVLESGISILFVADVGNFSSGVREKISKWVNEGGMLVRFAGERLAASDQQDLLPVPLRKRARNLSSTLSWSEPQNLASFDQQSPFFGIEVGEDIFVSKQVLSEPSADGANIWARLQDGTPLVTAAKKSQGRIVLFHTSANSQWSNLPLSGSFVEMLQRLTSLASSAGGENNFASDISLAPNLLLDGFGNLIAPDAKTKPLIIKDNIAQTSRPGFYGENESLVAINLFNESNKFSKFSKSNLPSNVQVRNLESQQPILFKKLFLLSAFLLFLLDCLVVLYMSGMFRVRVATACLILFLPMDLHSQELDFSPSLETQIGYVLTGDSRIDEISRKGLEGLSQFLAQRTALEPAPPRAVNIAKDELAFYPLLYWPVSAAQPTPPPSAMARVNKFMQQGGTVLFDTRDQNVGAIGANNFKLRELLSQLDIPPLEPVPSGHVLTKSFYLLEKFYGRFAGSQLWVEAASSEARNESDGVSSVLITSGDFAGAWAIEPTGNYTLPISPPNLRQRTLAYRAGVNIIMYTLTGNYKSDQVHAPALLKRLGQ